MRASIRVVPALALASALAAFVVPGLAQDRGALTSLKQIPDKIPPWKKKMTPSPEWRDQSIYFVFPDRFWNGDPSNDRAGHSNVDLTTGHASHGGDFRGLREKLDYVKGLGCTAIWITPVLQNWYGYHGYATCDFLSLDAHLGTLDDFRDLVDAAHKKGIAVIIDIVVNHEADLVYFKDGRTDYDEAGHEPAFYKVGKNEKILPNPVELQDLRLFHAYGNIDRWDDYDGKPCHTETGDFREMDDFRTELPEVRDAMCKIYKFWIAETDVDGFRIDTVKHVDRGFWQQFCPQIHQYATSIGKKGFFLFGEYWHGEDSRVGAMTGTKGGRESLFDGMLHFPLWNNVKDVFQKDQPPSRLAERFRNAKCYQDDALNVTFLDNHDMPRFLHGLGDAGKARLKVALAFLYAARGIPCLYYGTEQGFDGDTDPDDREDMFDNPAWSTNKKGDHFDASHELYRYVAQLNKVRRDLEPLRRGELVTRFADSSGPGLFVFSRVTAKDEVLVALNTAGEPKSQRVAIDRNLAGATLVDLLSGGKEGIQVGAAGVEISLPAHGARIYARRR